MLSSAYSYFGVNKSGLNIGPYRYTVFTIHLEYRTQSQWIVYHAHLVEWPLLDIFQARSVSDPNLWTTKTQYRSDYRLKAMRVPGCKRPASCRNMGLLSGTHNCGLHMRRECREHFPYHRFQRQPLVSDPSMHRGTCVTHVPWCMSGSLTRAGRENVPGIPSVWATRNFGYLVKGPL